MTTWVNSFELWMGLAAAFITFATLPIWRAGCRGSGLIDDPGDRKIHEQPIPLAGGLAILSGLLLPIMALPFLGKIGHPEPAVVLRLYAVVGGAAAMTLLGLIDDRFELRPVPKFAGQLLVAVAVSAVGLRFHLFPSPLDHVLTVLWILTVTNAFNFTDNMNGLCAGLASVGALGMAVLSARLGEVDSLVLCVLTAGAALGFLPWNFPRASAFLGDSGSHLLGFLLAALPLNAGLFSAPLPQVLGPLLFVTIPLIDLVQVVFLRWKLGQPFYHGDTNHLSHRFVRHGLSRPAAVSILWLLAAVSVAIGLAL